MIDKSISIPTNLNIPIFIIKYDYINVVKIDTKRTKISFTSISLDVSKTQAPKFIPCLGIGLRIYEGKRIKS